MHYSVVGAKKSSFCCPRTPTPARLVSVFHLFLLIATVRLIIISSISCVARCLPRLYSVMRGRSRRNVSYCCQTKQCCDALSRNTIHGLSSMLQVDASCVLARRAALRALASIANIIITFRSKRYPLASIGLRIRIGGGSSWKRLSRRRANCKKTQRNYCLTTIASESRIENEATRLEVVQVKRRITLHSLWSSSFVSAASWRQGMRDAIFHITLTPNDVMAIVQPCDLLEDHSLTSNNLKPGTHLLAR